MMKLIFIGLLVAFATAAEIGNKAPNLCLELQLLSKLVLLCIINYYFYIFQ